MPPKKKKVGVERDGPAALNDKEQLQRAQAEIVNLRTLLELKTHEAAEARRHEFAWRQKAEAAQAGLLQQQHDFHDIHADSERQLQVAKQQLDKRIRELTASYQQATQELGQRDEAVAVLQQERDELHQEIQAQAVEHQRRLAALQFDFSALMRDSLAVMQARLDAQHGGGALT